MTVITPMAGYRARFDHSQIVTNCYSCHNGSTATGKSISHVTSGNVCEDCHSTTAWIPAQFNHDNLTTNCSTCHNGVTATGKTQNHFITSVECDTCHRTNFWLPVIPYDHQSGLYPGDSYR